MRENILMVDNEIDVLSNLLYKEINEFKVLMKLSSLCDGMHWKLFKTVHHAAVMNSTLILIAGQICDAEQRNFQSFSAQVLCFHSQMKSCDWINIYTNSNSLEMLEEKVELFRRKSVQSRLKKPNKNNPTFITLLYCYFFHQYFQAFVAVFFFVSVSQSYYFANKYVLQYLVKIAPKTCNSLEFHSQCRERTIYIFINKISNGKSGSTSFDM